MKITTEQATQILADELTYGRVRNASLRQHEHKALSAITDDQYSQYYRAIDAINDRARSWDWSAVSNAIETAYALLGAAHPVIGSGDHSTGYAYHKGKHPIQAAQ